MRKNAWTLAELTVVMVAVVILTSATMSIMKNININKARVYVYSAMRNITMGNISVTHENNAFFPASAKKHEEDKTTDWYCLHFADAFSLEENPNCTKTSAGSMTANIVLSNGTTFRGFAAPWKTGFEGFYYKDILLDVDGDKNMNKMGVDRFPLRVFRGVNGQGENVSGHVYPVDCTSDILHTPEGAQISMGHAYCGSSGINIASNNEIVSYAIYRVTDPTNTTKANKIAASLSAIEADCLAYGSKGFYGGKVCQSKGFKIHERCAHTRICDGCDDYGVCYGGSKATCLAKAEANKMNVTLEDGTTGTKGYQCFTLMTQPTSGLGFMGGAMFGDMGM